ncbi:MAG: sugar phosphate isomerase/epimerase [Planctomycetes bacterium]|nr:sugar phosphate isomerase/epimerase [Planctomycetota bacterium]
MTTRDDEGLQDRRGFLRGIAAAGAGAGLLAASGGGALRLRAAGAEAETRGGAGGPLPGAGIELGFDNFSVRTMGLKAEALIDSAASLGVDVLLLSDLDVYESHDEAYLRRVRIRAAEKNVKLQAGTGSVCPTSQAYDASRLGPAEEHLRLLIRVAKAIGSPVARCYLGTRRDRQGDGGIERHFDAMVKTCRGVRSQAVDAGVKIAIENHAGDMQAWELASLIEAAGKDFVGATLDVGNAAWTLEDPMVNLEILGPYAATTGMRDSAIWETEKGATVMWANMGDGVTDWPAYVRRFKEVCPGVPFVLEILSYIWPADLPYLEPGFWDVFPKARAREFARFVALAKRGRKYEIPAGRPSGERSKDLEIAQQKWDLGQSLDYCRKVLGMGRKG